MNDINRKLLKLLLDKTRKRLLVWSRGSSINEYKTELNSATLNISYACDNAYNAINSIDIYYVHMYNGTGAPITLAREEVGDADFELLSELYDAARDSCTKETETIDNLLKELSELGV